MIVVWDLYFGVAPIAGVNRPYRIDFTSGRPPNPRPAYQPALSDRWYYWVKARSERGWQGAGLARSGAGKRGRYGAGADMERLMGREGETL
jgi:hypothetical protein